MQDKARFFAYSTWVIMISLAIIIFSDQFLYLVSQPSWLGLVVLLGFGLIYMNLAYNAVKRFIRKVPAPTKAHFALGGLIFLPPLCWILFIRETITSSEPLLLTVLAVACALGTFYGNRAGIRARYEYIQKLKEYQKKQ
jgi:drug/metabolite transporter (DMT)-like permease